MTAHSATRDGPPSSLFHLGRDNDGPATLMNVRVGPRRTLAVHGQIASVPRLNNTPGKTFRIPRNENARRMPPDTRQTAGGKRHFQRNIALHTGFDRQAFVVENGDFKARHRPRSPSPFWLSAIRNRRFGGKSPNRFVCHRNDAMIGA